MKKRTVLLLLPLAILLFLTSCDGEDYRDAWTGCYDYTVITDTRELRYSPGGNPYYIGSITYEDETMRVRKGNERKQIHIVHRDGDSDFYRLDKEGNYYRWGTDNEVGTLPTEDFARADLTLVINYDCE